MSIARQHQIHGVQPVLPVPDLAAAIDWFARVLGFEIDFLHGEPAFYARVKLGDRSWGDPVYIHLQQIKKATPPCGETRLHVGHDIDGLHAHALAQGAEVILAPTDQPWGLREIMLRAPGGHVLVLGAEIAPRPAAELPRAVLASFKPKPGQEAALLAVVREHVPRLQRLGLATMRASLIMQAADGTLVEAFEWVNAAAIDAAHHHPEVLAMWERFASACDYAALQDLAEARHPFAEFRVL